jgi:glycosyltransferase involved in cell wall biosynthesis
MAAPTVTVLIDTFNYGHFIEEAIASVLAQDFPAEHLEILVVDDGSTDDTAERVRKYASRVQYVCKANGGQASAFNFGLERSSGDIIAFLDADDYWLPGKLRSVVEEFDRNRQVGMVYHDFWKLWPDGGFTVSGYQGLSGCIPASRDSLLRYDFHPTSALAVRKSILDRILPVPEELVIQADAYLSACALFLAPVSYLSDRLMAYRIHGENLWSVPDSNQGTGRLKLRLATRRALSRKVSEWLKTNGFDVDCPNLRAFFAMWKISTESDEFRMSTPGRIRFFRHLIGYPRYCGARMTPRHKLVSYLNAFGALFTGYKHYHLLDDSRLRMKQALWGTRRAVNAEKARPEEAPAPLRHDKRS